MIWKTTLSFLANYLDQLKVPIGFSGGSKISKSGFKALFSLLAVLALSFSPGKAYAQCNSNNVTVTDFFFADENKNPIDPNGGYQIGDPVSGFIYASFGGSSGNGYSLYLEYDVYINDVFQQKVQTCLFNGQLIPQGTTEQISSFTWNWGDKLELKNYYMDWETNNKTRVCQKVSRNAQCYGAPFSILVRTPLVANFDFTTTCENFVVDFNNLTTGGDTDNYSYTWNFGGLNSSNVSDPNFDFETAGTYDVTLTVQDGISTSSLTKTVNLNDLLLVDFVKTDLGCGEVNTGEIDLSIYGGNQNYSVQWSGPNGFSASTQDLTGLAPGIYNATVNDTEGCTATVEVVIAQPEIPAAPVVAEISQPTCTVATGSFSITPVDGMEYSFGGGAFSSNTSWLELPADTYTVVARNADGCESAPLSVTINAQPATPAMPVVASITQPTCTVATGSFSITAVAGMEYSFGGGAFSSNTSWLELPADTYTVVARNADGCESAPLSVTINAQPATPAMPVVASITQPTCTVATGSFSITAVDGMEYSFGGGAFLSNTSWLELPADTYTVVARNADGCVSEALSVTINAQPATPAMPEVASTTQPTCTVATGSFSIIAVDGMTYSFNGAEFGTTTSWSELAAGTYTVVAKNADGCVSSEVSVTINAQPATPAMPEVAATTQPTCTVATGSFSIIAVDGMEYSFGGGAFSSNTSWLELPADTYTVVARNADGCESAPLSVTINAQPATPAMPEVASTTQPTCTVATGAFSVTAVDGMTYSFNGAEFGTTTSWSELAAGTYSVVAKNADGCVSSEVSVTINAQPATPAMPEVASTTQPTCTVATGSFSITAVAGMEYSFGGGAFSSNTSWLELPADTYTVVARNADGCESAPLSVTIDAQPATPAAPVVTSITQPTCTVATGSFSITAVDGMTYSFNGAEFGTTTSWSELAAGTYSVVAKNADGCISEELTVTINAQPATPAMPEVASTTQPTCTVATGSFSITAVDGMTYSFNGAEFGTTTSWSELAAGTYTVVAKNADGCVSEALSVTIDAQPATPDAPEVASTTQPTCTVATGSFSIIAVDGMTYSFNGAEFGTTTSWSELAAGTYSVVAKNADGCVSSELSVTINAQPATPAMPEVASITQPTCTVATGSFSITAVDGMTYSFGGGAFGTTTSWSNLTAGTYTVVAKNADGCVSEAVSVTINAQPATPAMPVVASTTQPTCTVATGSFSITAMDGMTYSFNGAEFGTTTSWSELAAGTYTVVAKNADGCVSSELSVTIDAQPATPDAPVVASTTQPTCTVATGSFSITAVDGMTYSFNGGEFGTTTSWSELAADTYTVVAKNADGCVSSELSVTINAQPATPDAPVVASTTQPTCTVATGSFSITAVDGMTYSFNGGEFGTTTSWSELVAGTYTVVAKNADGCESASLSVTINAQPATPAMPEVASTTQPTCTVATGSFSITAVDGMEYSFNGGTFGSTASWSELAAGTYTVVAKNADGCVSSELSVTINTQPATPAAPVVTSITQPTCTVATGSFSITAVDGMTYSFNGAEFGTTTSWSELAAGTYTVVAKNADGCVSSELSVTIDAQPATPAMPEVAATTQPTCTVATGSFSITAVDGMTYSFNGAEFGTTTSWSELAAGTYTVVAKNADGCVSSELSVTINAQPATPAMPEVAATTQPTCNVATGSFSITAVDGMTYSFNGAEFETTTAWSELAAGTYTVVAKNADGCVSSELSVTIQSGSAQPASPVVASVTQPTCTVATGSFSITAEAGMEYSFNGGAFGSTTSWSELAAGTYTVSARNAEGCISEATSVTINSQPEAPAVIQTTTVDLCIEDGLFDLDDLLVGEFNENGVWEDPANTGALSNGQIDPALLALGEYTFNYVVTEGDCSTTSSAQVSINDDCVVLACGIEDIKGSISKAVTPNGDQKNDTFEIGLDLDCDFTYAVQIFNRWGSKVYENNNYQGSGWDGTSDSSLSGSQLPAGTYYYIVEIRNSELQPIQGYIYLGSK